MIHHPLHGIGQVQGTEEKELLGQELSFVHLYFEREELKLMLPAKQLANTVRAPINAKRAARLIDALSDIEPDIAKSWKARHRRNQELLESGDPRKLAEAFKTLALLKHKKGSLNNTERRQFQLSQELLVEELSYACGESEQAVLQQILAQCTSDNTTAA